MKNIQNKLRSFFFLIKSKVLELVGKNEQPKPPVTKSYITDEFRQIVEDVEKMFSGVMTIKKDIIAMRYVNQGKSLKEIAEIFHVSETTIRRRQKFLKYYLGVTFKTLREEFPDYNTKMILAGMKEYYGPTFKYDEQKGLDIIL